MNAPRRLPRQRHNATAIVAATVVACLITGRAYAEDASDKASAADAKARKVERVTDLFRLVVKDDVIRLESDLPPTEQPVMYVSPELPAGAEVLVKDRSLNGQPPGTVTFHFYTPPRRIETLLGQTTVNAQPATLIIAQDVAGLRQVELHQRIPSPTAGPIVGDGQAVRMYVHLTNPLTGQTEYRNSFPAATLAELRREHPEEVGRFLIPVLRTIGQERTLLAPEPATVFQVLRGHADPDPAVVEQVTQLVKQLDSPDPRTRDQAAASISALGAQGAITMMAMDRTSLSAEQNSRLDMLVSSHAPVSEAEAQELRQDPMFLVDCLYLEDRALRQAALVQLEQVIDQKVDFNLEAKGQEELLAIAALREKAIATPTKD